MTPGDLSEVLELLHRGDTSFRTLRATIVARRDDDLGREAFRRSIKEAELRGIKTLTVGVGFDGPRAEAPGARMRTERTRLWFEPPDRLRAEKDGRRPMKIVMDGRHEFRTAARGDEIVRGPLRSPYELVSTLFLLCTSELSWGYLLEPLGETEVAGRAALAVRARLRPGEGGRLPHLQGFSWGADEHSLAIDRERGVLLRVAAVIDGHEYEVTEMVEVGFDEPVEPDVFRFVAAPGVVVITAEDEARRLRALWSRPRRSGPLDQMARQARFVLFAPSEEGRPIGHQSSTFHDDCVSAEYTQLWADESHTFGLVLRPQADHEAAPPAVSEDADGLVIAHAVRDGTSIEVSSRTLGRERLLEVLATLEPVEPT